MKLNKIRIIIFGVGQRCEWMMNAMEAGGIPDRIEIVGYADNDIHKCLQLYHNKMVYHASRLKELVYDKIVITSYFEEIRLGLQTDYQIPDDKIECELYLLKLLMEEKYKDTENEEIKEVLKFWEKHPLTVFNQLIPEEEEERLDEIFWDKIKDLPYAVIPDVLGKEKKLYYPRNYPFIHRKGKSYIKNIMYEQYPGSPHEYVNENMKVRENGILVDAGVYEGNFSIRYADIVSKIYLIECDEQWREPLYYTFYDYQDKIVFCNRFLTNVCNKASVTLDSLVKEGTIDFLKMDIEGEEEKALQGAERVLRNSPGAECAICSYHKKDAEKEIRTILNKYDFETTCSKGYMLFYYDFNIFKSRDFRRGIVYGKKMADKKSQSEEK